MTREEEIRTAVDTIVQILPSNNGRTYEQALIASGVEAGIKWADENPKSPWISIKDDLPCNHNELICSKEISEGTETVDVFAMNERGDIWTDYMVYENGKWRWNDFQPDFWMVPPKLQDNRGLIYGKR